MTCRSSMWSALLQADLFHTVTLARLRESKHVPCCISCSPWSLKQEAAVTKLVMTSWLCCGLLPTSQKLSHVAAIKYFAWGSVHGTGSYSFLLWCLLALVGGKAGFLQPREAALHLSAPLQLQPGKESSAQFVEEGRSHRGGAGFSQALAFAGHSQQWPRSCW